jgi:hypothetical protein
MSFPKLIAKVRQAEDAVEAHERRAVADWRQLRRTWRASWTPGRILIGGLAAGFLVGRRDTAGRDGGPSLLRLLSMLSSLLATSSARYAAHQADEAADSADDVADAVAPRAGGAV